MSWRHACVWCKIRRLVSWAHVNDDHSSAAPPHARPTDHLCALSSSRRPKRQPRAFSAHCARDQRGCKAPMPSLVSAGACAFPNASANAPLSPLARLRHCDAAGASARNLVASGGSPRAGRTGAPGGPSRHRSAGGMPARAAGRLGGASDECFSVEWAEQDGSWRERFRCGRARARSARRLLGTRCRRRVPPGTGSSGARVAGGADSGADSGQRRGQDSSGHALQAARSSGTRSRLQKLAAQDPALATPHAPPLRAGRAPRTPVVTPRPRVT